MELKTCCLISLYTVLFIAEMTIKFTSTLINFPREAEDFDPCEVRTHLLKNRGTHYPTPPIQRHCTIPQYVYKYVWIQIHLRPKTIQYMFYFIFMCFEKLSIKATGSIYVKHNTLINAACPQFIILFGALNSHMF